MRDIKIKTNRIINVNKSVEKEISNEIDFHRKSQYILSTILFGFMTVSVFTYIFLISSSIFYTVKANQFDYQASRIVSTYSSIMPETNDDKFDKERISFIDNNLETSISLK